MSSDRIPPQNTSLDEEPQTAARPTPALSAPSAASAAPSPPPSTYVAGAYIGAGASGDANPGSQREAIFGSANKDAIGGASGEGANGVGDNGNGANIIGASGNEAGGELQKRALMDHLMQSMARDTLGSEERASGGSRFSAYMGTLRRRWQPMLLVFLVTLPLVAWKLKPGATTYVAETRILLPSGMTDNVSALDVSGLGGLKVGGTSKVDTQIAIITSPMVIGNANQRLPKALRDPLSLVVAKSTVSADLIDISTTAQTPRTAVVLANAIVEEYASYLRREISKSGDKSLEFVGSQLKKAKADLLNAKRDLQRYKERYNIFNIERALESSTTQIELLTQKAGEARTEVASDSAVQSDGAAMGLQQKALDARLNYEEVLREFTDAAPEALRARAKWTDAQQQYAKRAAAVMQTARRRLSDAETALGAAKARAAVLPSLEFKLSQLVDNAAAAGATYRALGDKYTALGISSSAQTAVPKALTPATYAKAIVPTWMRPILLGMLASLVLASLLAVLLEQIDTTIHSTQDLEPLLRTSLLGTMPLLRGKTERRLTHLQNPSLEAPVLLEACRILRSNLTFASVDVPLRSVLVTSADPGEGKSLSALNLAAVMAMDGRRVVLLDCDLRRPTQHLLAEVAPEPGFSNILTGESTLEEALRQTPVANLSLIPAGTLPPNPPELLGSEHGRRLLRDLRERFDLVVIDSPPVLSLADPQVLCSMVDGVMLVVAANSTSKEHLQRAQATMRHAGGRLLGVLFNKVQERNDIHNANNYYTYSALDSNSNRGITGLLKRR